MPRRARVAMAMDNDINDLRFASRDCRVRSRSLALAAASFVGRGLGMNQKPVKQAAPLAVAANDAELAPATAMLSSRLIVLANLLKRGAILRYKRLVGLSPVEFGLVASLGRRPPMSVIRLAEAVGMDKGQISRALAELVSRRLVAKEINPRDNRETLVCLTKAGLAAHDTIVAGAHERNRRLLEQLGKEELAGILDQIDRLTETAAVMLADEKDQA
jgi:DNA-binding MarR family transcriptional regulator